MESALRTYARDEQNTAELDGSSSLTKSLERTFEDLRNLVTCQICVKPMYEPYMIACGHSFCYSCLAQWFQTHRKKETCPDCRMKVYRPPAPAYVIRQMTHLFVSKAELMPAGETTAEHQKAQIEEAEIVQHDKSNQDQRVGGLFRGSFRPSSSISRVPITDHEDGVQRCPACTWELEDGRCNFCHASYLGSFSGESDMLQSETSEYDVNSEGWSLDGDISLDEAGQSIHAADEPPIGTTSLDQQLPTHRSFHPIIRPFLFGRTAAHGLNGRPIPRHGRPPGPLPNRRGQSSTLSEVTNTTDNPTPADALELDYDEESEDQYDAGSLADFVQPDTPYQDQEADDDDNDDDDDEDEDEENGTETAAQNEDDEREIAESVAAALHGQYTAQYPDDGVANDRVLQQTLLRELNQEYLRDRRQQLPLDEDSNSDEDSEEASSLSSESSDSDSESESESESDDDDDDDSDDAPAVVPTRNRKRRRIIVDDDEDEESDSRAISEVNSPRSHTRPRIESSSSTADHYTSRTGSGLMAASSSAPIVIESSSPDQTLSSEPEYQFGGRLNLIHEAMGRSFSRIGIARELRGRETRAARETRTAPSRRLAASSAYSVQSSRSSGMPISSLASRLVTSRHARQ